jgi:hypothetical protein
MRRPSIPPLTAAGLLILTTALGADATAGQSLDQTANDPTASLMAVQVQNLYSGNYYNLHNRSGNTVLLRPVVPYTTGALSHIARATIPYATLTPSGKTGLGDSVLFDLIVFDQSWGR